MYLTVFSIVLLLIIWSFLHKESIRGEHILAAVILIAFCVSLWPFRKRKLPKLNPPIAFRYQVSGHNIYPTKFYTDLVAQAYLAYFVCLCV